MIGIKRENYYKKKIKRSLDDMGWIPLQTKSTFKILEVPGIEPATKWSVFKHADP